MNNMEPSNYNMPDNNLSNNNVSGGSMPNLKNQLKPGQVFNRVGWFLCMMAAIVLIVELIIMVPAMIIKPGLVNSSTFLIIISAISYYLIGFPIYALCMRTVPNGECLEKKKLGAGKFLIYFLIGFALLNIANFVNVAFAIGYEAIFHKEFSDSISQVVTKADWVTLVFTVILAPIFEELTFRYFALNKLRNYGDKVAILVTSFLFGFYHMNFNQFIYATVLGMLLAYVTLKTNRIRYSIGIHMLVNFFGGVAGLWVEGTNSEAIMLGFYILYYVMILIGIVLFALNYKKVHLDTPKERLAKPFQTAVVNPGMLVFYIGCFLMMVLTLVSQVLTGLLG